MSNSDNKIRPTIYCMLLNFFPATWAEHDIMEGYFGHYDNWFEKGFKLVH